MLYRDLAVANQGGDTVSVRLCLDNGTFGHEDVYPVGHQPGSIKYGDLNGDGWGDLVTANSGTNTVSVLMNLGVGANFAAATDYVVGLTNPVPKDLTIGDINRDGRLDLIVANFNESSVSVLTNLGGGVFGGLTNYPVGTGPSSIIQADINGDKLLDVITANSVAGTISILYGTTNGTLSPAVNATLEGVNPQPVCVRAADLNRDTILDLVTADYNSNRVSILIGNASGGFWTIQEQYSLSVGFHPKSLCIRDFNNDGISDIAVVNEGDNNVQVFLGNGDGTFEDQGVFEVGDTPAAVDGSNFNSDQSNDLAVVNSGDNNVSILMYSGPMAYGFKQNVIEDTPINIVLRGSMLSGEPLLYVLTSSPTNGDLTGYGTSDWLYTPTNDYFGGDSFSYQTVDVSSSLTSAVAVVSIQVLPVNDRPSFLLATNQITVLEDSATTRVPGFAINMRAGPDNETNQSMTFVVTTTNKGFFAVSPAINPSGLLTFRPALNVTGSAPVFVKVRDSGGTLRGGTNLSEPDTFSVVVTPHPLKPHKGKFAGLYLGTNGVVEHSSSGFFTFTMSAYGSFSGTVIGDTGKYPFRGQFDLSGHAQVDVPRNASTLTLDLLLDLTNGTEQVNGTVTDSQTVYANLSGDRAIFSTATNPAQVGHYTFVIPGVTNNLNAPIGDGYGTVKVASNGTITASGTLSDGTAFSQSVSISKDGRWPFYVSLLGGDGSVFSWLTFTNLSGTRLDGNVSWIRPASSSKYYPAGFTNLTAAIGSTYTAPIDGQRVLATTNNLFILNGGNLDGSITNVSGLSTNNSVYVNGSAILSLTTTASGYMSGSFVHPTLKVSKTLRGVALQDQVTARGFFLGTNQCGSFLLLPTD